MNCLKKTEKGFAQLVILGVMALMAVALPITTNLVKQKQENRSRAAEEGNVSCDVLRDTSKKFFEVCADFDNVCFNKNTGEYQGCGNINGSNGGDCTDPEHNTNANNNMLCSVKKDISLSCDTLYGKKQKYFAICAGAGNTGACFDKQTGEYKGCVSNYGNSCNDSSHILCPVKSDDLGSWTNAAGKCGSAYGKTFESTPTSDLCESGKFSRALFLGSDHKYYWRCGDVEKYGNEAANCFAVVNGKAGSSKITLDRTQISLGVGKSFKINAKLDPVNSNESVTWSTNLPEYFSVDSSGNITGLKANASGYVTAMTSGGYGASVMVDITEGTEKVDGVCGSANGGTFSTRPEDNLCIGSVMSTGRMEGKKYVWTCYGVNGGFISECWANIGDSSSVPPTMTPIASKPYLFLKTDKNTYSVGQTFTVTAGVNSTTNKIGGVDGVVNYKTDVLSLISVKKSPNFVFKNSDDDCVINKNFTNGKATFTCFVGDSNHDKAVEGDLVVLTFTVKHSGVSDIAFECDPGAIFESNIVVDSKDVIDCSRNINQKISTNNSSVSNSPKCGLSGTYKTTPSRESLCEVGVPTSVLMNRTTMVYTWKCLVGNETKSCSARPENGGMLGEIPKVTPSIAVGDACVSKEGVNTFSVDTECELGNFRYMTFVCYDGYTKREGGLSSCKSSELWRSYADESCKGHKNDCSSGLIPTPQVISGKPYSSTAASCKAKDGVCATYSKTLSNGSECKVDGYATVGKVKTDLCPGDKKTVCCTNVRSSRITSTPTPIAAEQTGMVGGKCGVTRNSCVVGVVNDGDVPDTSVDYKWRCLGLEGGKNVLCTMKKPVNGKCGTKKRTCINGTVNDESVTDTATYYKWKCVGKYGGKTVSCSARK